ncbi:MAG TPA: transcription antitermination factor NusB [Saprospiraceae bacterium]|nr:transcription antitermination factor NusB [Saprospiraceae bacterium]MCC6688323.1 transcription antitermination factor NusB [Saprospiraceae bacterium]HMV24420.1 transcription antitermination factor NusB [Saprospiraceae bacterium]HMX82402.1 transcription antitermination factor NusB [Saprospiraceae bacterium]HMX85697.1 transcription antitermination factor NusB [Saprospiraceae bacterium]
MLSRRNVRIKVLQVIYGSNINHDKIERYQRNYQTSIDRSLEILVYSLRVMQKILKYSLTDAENRKYKKLPSDNDKLFKPVLLTNKQSQNLMNSQLLEIYTRKFHTDTKIDQDVIRRLYLEFSKDEDYIQYYIAAEHTTEENIAMLLKIYKLLTKNEVFNETIEDHYVSWDDDESLVVGAMKKIIKSLDQDEYDFLKDYIPDDETVKEFGETLLIATVKNDKSLVELITPFLENWELERVAAIDLIMLKMAVTEILRIESIPTKVTLNEYVEISKIYSTEKSKEFINGILDRIINKLNNENKIIKTGRGLDN